ncbi:MAG: hypothetical protein CV087_11095, partial [Candidatus Brocadia sp. WS118]
MTADEIIKNILPAMVLAPSAHNTQPWSFKVSDNVIDVYVDWSRHLEVSDPTLRELYVSIGCTVENGVVAGRHFSRGVQVMYFPEGDNKDQPAVRMVFSKSDTSGGQDLFEAITARRTNRLDYDGKPLTPEERAKLPSVNDQSVVLIEDHERIEEIAKVSGKGTYKTLGRSDFKRELSKWVRNNWTRKPDGMPGYAMGIPAPLSLLASTMVRIAPIHKQEAPKVEKEANQASAIAVVVTHNDNKEAWIKAGQILERIWLEATAAGLAAMPLTAAIESSDDDRKIVQTITRTNLFPQGILRIGHTSKLDLKASPRRS